MILYPAIDLKDGRCVRLRQGDMAQATVFNASPQAQAKSFQAAGFQWLHVVDLDGAFAGASANGDAVKAILSALTIPVQLGGGIRTHAHIDAWLAAGVARVILGTAAVREPQLVKDAARAHPGKVAVGIDARDGMVSVEGWAETSSLKAIELAKRFEDAGVAAIIFTDIARDGMMGGANIEATAEMAGAVSIPVIASGGVNGVQDVVKLAAVKPKIAGVVIGRALYDGRIDPAEALAAAKS
jgi:phosphoribosylformimino-5-aminoimidazole carboxamide ribotide isomerase